MSSAAMGYPMVKPSRPRPDRQGRPQLPKPGNDNLPRPANDNVPRPGTKLKRLPKRPPRPVPPVLLPFVVAGAAYHYFNPGTGMPPNYDMSGWNLVYRYWWPEHYAVEQGEAVCLPHPTGYVPEELTPLASQGTGDHDTLVANFQWANTVGTPRSAVSFQENYWHSPTIQRARVVEGWTRTVDAGTVAEPPPQPAEVPANTPWFKAPVPVVLPEVPLWLDPFAAPIAQPTPWPQPAPIRVIPALDVPSPWRTEWEQPVRFNSPPVPANAPPVEAPGPVTPPDIVIAPPSPSPNVGTPTQPSNPVQPGSPTVPGLAPDPGTNPAPNPPTVQPPANRPRVEREPPGRGEKERKIRIKRGGVAQAIHRVVGNATEFLDTVNALWKVLPDECKTGYFKLHYRDSATGEVRTYYKRRFRASQKQRMADLYRCWTHMDMQKAVEALVSNQLEDQLYAQLGRAAGEAGKRAGNPYGFGLGPWDQPPWLENLGIPDISPF